MACPILHLQVQFFIGYPMGAPVNILNMCSYEDFLPWKNNFMLKSGANIFVSQILVQGRCVMFVKF